jgi:hypothetical protein
MRRSKLSDLSVEQLVQEFASLAIEQDEALLSNAQSKANRLFWKLEAVESELRARPGDQRTALLPLYDNENMQVRVKAAKATLAVAPHAARAQLEAIRESKWQPAALEAGMSLINLDRGIFKPT